MPSPTKTRAKKPSRSQAAASVANGRSAKHPAAAISAVEPDLAEARELVMQLMAISGTSGHEGAMAQFVTEKLIAAGADRAAIRSDNAHRKTPIAGEVGNLILQLPGSHAGPRRMLMAHMDTVPICVGSQPVQKGNFVASANPNSGLGADDRAGVAAILATSLAILRRGLPHPPLTFGWFIQEEVGLHGARHVQLGLLGRPKLVFNFDGGAAEKITIGATGGYRLQIDIKGLASHAGGAPEQGVSAIAIAALAIADLVKDGWHGDIRRGRHRGTSNVGVIHGGEATNVVTDHVSIKAEARSHDPKFRQKIVAAIEKSFARAAKAVRSANGTRGEVKIEGRLDYESFRLADDEPAVLAAEAAVRAVGGEPLRYISNGGLDANWMTAHGLPTVTLGCGQLKIHTVSEQLDLAAFDRACQIALRLATGT